MKISTMLSSFGLICGFGGIVYAAHSAKELKMLNDSAAALSSSNPDLSLRLTDFAKKESTEKNGDEMREAGHSDDVQLLKQAADALRKSHPDLARDLRRYAAREEREEHGNAPMRKRSTHRPASGS